MIACKGAKTGITERCTCCCSLRQLSPPPGPAPKPGAHGLQKQAEGSNGNSVAGPSCFALMTSLLRARPLCVFWIGAPLSLSFSSQFVSWPRAPVSSNFPRCRKKKKRRKRNTHSGRFIDVRIWSPEVSWWSDSRGCATPTQLCNAMKIIQSLCTKCIFEQP